MPLRQGASTIRRVVDAIGRGYLAENKRIYIFETGNIETVLVWIGPPLMMRVDATI